MFNAINLNLYHYAGNNPMKYTDPDGKAIRITITNKKTDFIFFQFGYIRGTENFGLDKKISVSTYIMTITDDVTKKTLNFEVTRDAIRFNDDGTYTIFNYNPKNETGKYIGNFTDHTVNGYGIAISLYDSNGGTGSMFDSIDGSVNDAFIMIHVGGEYYNTKLNQFGYAISYGCFTLMGNYKGEKGWQEFMKIITDLQKLQKDKTIIIEVEKIEK